MVAPNCVYGGSYKEVNTVNKSLALVLANAAYDLPLMSGCKIHGHRERTIESAIRRKALNDDRSITEYGWYLLDLYSKRNPLEIIK